MCVLQHSACTCTIRPNAAIQCVTGIVLHFMDPATYEQEAVTVQTFGEHHDYLVEDMEATLSFHEGAVISGQICS